MKEKEITIIIPVYNSFKYLNKTLKSIAMQTMKDKIKVIIVNDGSNKSCEEYISNFKDVLDINEIYYKKNKGQHYAKNLGIKNANTKYVMFIDSDDWYLKKDSIEILYKEIENNKGVYVVSGEVKDDEDSVNSDTYTTGKIYNLQLIKKYNIKYPKLKTYEDLAFNLQIYFLIDNKTELIQLDLPIYFYNKHNPNSIIANNKKGLLNSYNYIKAYEYAKSQNKKYQNSYYQKYAYTMFLSMVSRYYKNFENNKMSKPEEISEYLRMCQKFYNKYKKYIERYRLVDYENKVTLNRFFMVMR